MLQYLLKKGANPNIKDKDSVSPLMVATVYKRFVCAQILVEFKANVDHQNALGCTAGHIAASRGYLRIFGLLLEHSDNVNIVSNRGWNMLMFAAKNGHTDILYQLLKHDDIEINAANKAECSALILAAYAGHTDIVSLLLKYGADYAKRDKFGMSAHVWGTKKKFTDVVDILRAHGSKLSVRDKFHALL